MANPVSTLKTAQTLISPTPVRGPVTPPTSPSPLPVPSAPLKPSAPSTPRGLPEPLPSFDKQEALLAKGIESCSSETMRRSAPEIKPSGLEAALKHLEQDQPRKVVYAIGSDETVRLSAESLAGKRKGEVQEHQLIAHRELASLGPRDKLTIVAHGSPDGTRIGGMPPKQLAEHLHTCGLRQIGKISLKSCDSAAFARELMQQLQRKGIMVESITGRTGQVFLSREGRTLVDGLHQGPGAKLKVTPERPEGIDPYAGALAPEVARRSFAIQAHGLHGPLGGEEALLQDAYALCHSQPDQAALKARQVLSEATGPDRAFYAIRALEVLQLSKAPDFAVQLQGFSEELLKASPGSEPRLGRFILEAGRLWDQHGHREAALGMYQKAAEAAQVSGDYGCLLTLARQLDGATSTKQEALLCLHQGLRLALAAPLGEKPADLPTDILTQLEYWSKLPSAWSSVQAHVPELGRLMDRALDAAKTPGQVQELLDLSQRLLSLDQRAKDKTDFPYQKAFDRARLSFEAHLKEGNLEQAQAIGASLADLSAQLSMRSQPHGAELAKAASDLLGQVQLQLKARVELLNTEQQELAKQLSEKGMPAGLEIATKLSESYAKLDKAVASLLACQELQLQTVFVSARSDSGEDKTRALRHLGALMLESQTLLGLPDRLIASLSPPGIGIVAPGCRSAVIASLLQNAQLAVDQRFPSEVLPNLEGIIKAVDIVKDPSLNQAGNQLILSTARLLLNHPEESHRNLGRDLLVNSLPRLLQGPEHPELLPGVKAPQMPPEDRLEIARLLHPVAPEKAAELIGPIVVTWIKTAGTLASDKPDEALAVLGKSLEALRATPSLRESLLPEIHKGVLHLIDQAANQGDTDRLREAMQLARVYSPKEKLGEVYFEALLSRGKALIDSDPHTSLQLLTLASELAPGQAQLQLTAENLIELAGKALIANQALGPLGYGQVALQATQEVMGIAYRLDAGGENRHLAFSSTLQGLLGELRTQLPSERVNDLIAQGESLYNGHTIKSPILKDISSTTSLESDFQAIPSLDGFNHAGDISKASLHKETTLVHYRSDGHPKEGSERARDVDLKIDKFAQIVGRKSQLAYEELKSTQFASWDKSKGHFARKCLLKTQWDSVKKAYGLPDNQPVPESHDTRVSAVFYDLQRLSTIGKKGAGSDYDEELKKLFDSAELAYEKDRTTGVSPLKSAEERFIKARMDAHKKDDAPDTAKAAKESVAMLSTLGGYLIEERTYQLLKSDSANKEQIMPWLGEKVGWTDQDTSILGGSTRPDLTLRIPGENLHLLMDFTAFNSQGHIFNKTPSWTGSKLVADSIEVLYPSMTKTELKSFILEGKALSQEEIQQIQQAYAAEKAAIKERQAQLGTFVRDMHKMLRGGNFDKDPLLAKGTDARISLGHLAKRFGLAESSPSSKIELKKPQKAKTEQVNLAIEYYLNKAKDMIANPGNYGLDRLKSGDLEAIRYLESMVAKIDLA